MSVELTRGEWLAARKRLKLGPESIHTLLKDAFGVGSGAPTPFCKDGCTLVKGSVHSGRIAIPDHALTLDEAEGMGEALIKHARYVRKMKKEQS